MKDEIDDPRSSIFKTSGKGALFETFDVKAQVHFVPEFLRQMFRKVFLFL